MFSCLILKLANLAGSLADSHELALTAAQKAIPETLQGQLREIRASYAIFCWFK